MMSMADIFLSDVHIYTDNVGEENVQEPRHVVSRFEFNTEISSADNRAQTAPDLPGNLQDEDGDLILTRKLETSREIINIYHAMATPLSLVGLQVWRGALLLADYLLCNRDIVKDRIVLELGAGTGLCSIVCALHAKHVFATDMGNEVLSMCHKNYSQNRHIASDLSRITTRELDWTRPLPFESGAGDWTWLPEDKELLYQCSVVLAADVVYDNDISDAFLNTVWRITTTLPVSVLYLALEKRLNFTLDDLEVACPAYTYFFQKLANCSFVLSYRSVPTNFYQSFRYERVQQL